jgi:hypothetical protein
MNAFRGGVVAAALAVVGCQTYDFEPVRPLAIAQTDDVQQITATKLKPDLMILLDKSGSMAGAINPTGTCATCSFPMCNEGTCPTRMGQMQAAMNTFLTSSGDVARMGFTVFPNVNVSQCGASNAQSVVTQIKPASDMPADLKSWAAGINTQIQAAGMMSAAAYPGGGTPTGDSIRFVSGIKELNDPTRDDFILLLTDGLPNCNIMNPNTCLSGAACGWTLASSQQTMMASNDSNYCIRGCLDQDGTVQAIREARDVQAHANGIRTIVVGFGSDFTGSALDTLNAMAIAGGFQATCPMGTDAECGANNTCDTTTMVCTKAFFSAANQTQLQMALAQISAVLGADQVCTYVLTAQPSSDQLVSVLINGTATASGADTWVLQAGKIQFQGALCNELKMSTAMNPVTVEVRVVQSL